MADDSANITVAYGDESVRMVGDPPFYMLGVCLLGDVPDSTFEELAKVMPPGARKLHWRGMSQGLQRESLRLISGIERVDLVVIAAPLDGKKQERARRKCLEALLPELERRGIEEVVLESRGVATDKLDLNYTKFAKGSKIVKSISVSHEEGSAEPRLWLADQVVGAMGDYLTQTSNWKHWKPEWEAMSPRIERIDVSL